MTISMVQVANQQFLVTGGASGIGLATARLLHKMGAALILWDVNELGLEKVRQELGAKTAVVDITQAEAVETAVSELSTPLNGVIHAAGIMHAGLFSEQSLADQQQMIEVNLIGTLNIAKLTLPSLATTRGSLILLASISAFQGPPEFAIYGASKAGVLSLAQALRLELEREGVHIGVVCPFFVATPMLEQARQATLFRFFGVAHTPDAVAAAIVKGIRYRRFMIWPSWYPAFFHWLSHIGYPLSHHTMKLFWNATGLIRKVGTVKASFLQRGGH